MSAHAAWYRAQLAREASAAEKLGALWAGPDDELTKRLISVTVDRGVSTHALTCGVPAVEAWAKAWIDGSDRSAESAALAAEYFAGLPTSMFSTRRETDDAWQQTRLALACESAARTAGRNSFQVANAFAIAVALWAAAENPEYDRESWEATERVAQLADFAAAIEVPS